MNCVIYKGRLLLAPDKEDEYETAWAAAAAQYGLILLGSHGQTLGRIIQIDFAIPLPMTQTVGGEW